MSLYDRIAGSAALVTEDEVAEDGGIYVLSADLFTANWIVRAEMTSPESRLSDCLNGSLPALDVRPTSASARDADTPVDLAGTSATLTKDRILMAIPVREWTRDAGLSNPEWRPMVQHRCWIALGPYRLLGTLHVERGRDPRAALRSTGKQFVAVTQVNVTGPTHESQQFPVVLVNQTHIDLLAVKDIA